jgi:hypothetical protein
LFVQPCDGSAQSPATVHDLVHSVTCPKFWHRQDAQSVFIVQALMNAVVPGAVQTAPSMGAGLELPPHAASNEAANESRIKAMRELTPR